MEGTIRTDRRFTLGEFKYTTFEDTIENIPQDLYLNQDFLSTLRYLQLLSFEIAYRKYVKLVSVYPHSMDLDKAVEALESLREQELLRLKTLLNGKKIQDNTLEE